MTSSLPASPTVVPGTGAPECHERLAEQLYTLSQVVETITYRLLELEERLGEQESQLKQLQAQAGGAVQLSEGAEQRFDDTEERLMHLESLLNGMASTSAVAAARHLQPVRASEGHQAGLDDPGSIDGPFLEEPEQPFMDDLEASDSQLDLDELEDLTA
jgi:chromosome segregation ATPase